MTFQWPAGPIGYFAAALLVDAIGIASMSTFKEQPATLTKDHRSAIKARYVARSLEMRVAVDFLKVPSKVDGLHAQASHEMGMRLDCVMVAMTANFGAVLASRLRSRQQKCRIRSHKGRKTLTRRRWVGVARLTSQLCWLVHVK